MHKRKRKTLLFAPFANWKLHYETDLELAQRALDDGDELTIVYCDGELPSCEPNPLHKPVMCRMCRARRNAGFRWLEEDNITFLPLSKIAEYNAEQIDEIAEGCSSVDEVKSFEMDGSDLGMAAVSSTVSYYREPKLNWDEHGDILGKHLKNALLVHLGFSEFLDKHRFDRIILFNGRYSSLRPLLRLAQRRGLELLVHERGYEFGKFSLTHGTYPHAIQYIEDEIIRYAQDPLPEEEKRKIGAEWFLERRAGVSQNWKSFTREQKEGFAREILNRDEFNITLFNSSEDEFVAIEEWKNPYYDNQNSGIRKILKSFENEENIRFFLRVHPNLRDVENSQTRELERLAEEFDHLTVIPPESPMSTYELLDKADLILTFGSSVGIEAAFAGKPSIVMGRAPYLVLESCIVPVSHEAMVEIVKGYKERGVLPQVKDQAYLYGYYMKKSGVRYKYLRQTGISDAVMLKNDKETNLSTNSGVFVGWIERALLKIWKLIKEKVG